MAFRGLSLYKMAVFVASVALLCSIDWTKKPIVVGSTVVVHPRVAIDGNTFYARTPEGAVVRFRLRLVDAPVLSQPFGPEARRLLRRLLFAAGGEVVCRVTGTDQWGAYVADVATRDRPTPGEGPKGREESVQEAMVREGFAWVADGFVQGAGLRAVMEEARAARRGLWIDEAPVKPWVFRRGRRLFTEEPRAKLRRSKH